MAISTTANRVAYNGNGAATSFSFPYAFQAQDDLKVVSTVIATGVETVKALTTDYTISGTTDGQGFYPSGGSVNMLVAPASGTRLTIYRDPEATQLVDLVENDPLPAEVLESAYDKAVMLIQRVKDIVTRSLRQPDGDSADIAVLPAKVVRAGKLLAFDNDGDPEAVAAADLDFSTVSSFAATLLDDADAAEARTTLGAAGSATTVTGAGLATGGGDLSANRTITVTEASQAEAEAGVSQTVAMSPLRTAQAIAALSARVLLKRKTVRSSAVATTTTGIPRDDTIPQWTEGGNFLETTYTPLNAANTIKVRGHLMLSTTVNGATLTAALFVDGASNANAVAADAQQMSTQNTPVMVPFEYEFVAGGTSSKTFTVRGGDSTGSPNTTTLNGSNGSRLYGGVASSFMTIEEYET